MSISTKSIITSYGFLPSLHIKTSHGSRIRISLSSSSNFGCNNRRLKADSNDRRRSIVCSVVQPGVPPPSKPPFNFINWIVGVAVTVVLPFFSHKWASLLKFKNEVDTAVEVAEEIVVAVEKAAEGVEKLAEGIAGDLPEGGSLRKAVDFVENMAERASKDAHIVEDFIDKVQEVEEKVEEYVECLTEEATHEHHKEEEEEKEEDRVHEQAKVEETRENELLKEENITDDIHKH